MTNTLDIVAEKKALRAAALAKRNAIPQDDRMRKSLLICRSIARALDAQAADLGHAPVVAVYAPIKSEVDVTDFSRHAYEQGATVLFPCMNEKTHEHADPMHMRRVAKERFENGSVPFIAKPIESFAQNDPELSEFPIVHPEKIDTVIVPMVAFDDSLMRLGYGGGNYDAFLKSLRPETLVIGVAFEEQRIERVPAEPHDLSLPRIERA